MTDRETARDRIAVTIPRTDYDHDAGTVPDPDAYTYLRPVDHVRFYSGATLLRDSGSTDAGGARSAVRRSRGGGAAACCDSCGASTSALIGDLLAFVVGALGVLLGYWLAGGF